MQLTKPIMLLIVGSALAVGVVRLTFLSVSSSKAVAGCPANLSQEGIDPTQTVAFWQNQPIAPQTTLAQTISEKDRQVLGSSTGGDKWIEIDLSDQKIIAHQGSEIFLESPISSQRPLHHVFRQRYWYPRHLLAPKFRPAHESWLR